MLNCSLLFKEPHRTVLIKLYRYTRCTQPMRVFNIFSLLMHKPFICKMLPYDLTPAYEIVAWNIKQFRLPLLNRSIIWDPRSMWKEVVDTPAKKSQISISLSILIEYPSPSIDPRIFSILFYKSLIPPWLQNYIVMKNTNIVAGCFQ